jgi:hypothetical protein
LLADDLQGGADDGVVADDQAACWRALSAVKSGCSAGRF